MQYQTDTIFTISRWRQNTDLPLWVCFIEKKRQESNRFHSHSFMEVVLVRGHGIHLLEDWEVPVSDGDILVIPPGLKHAYQDCDELEILNLVYEPSPLLVPVLDGFQLPFFNRFFPQKNDCPDAEAAAHPALHPSPEVFEELWKKILHLGEFIHSVEAGRNFLALGCFLNIIGELARLGGSAVSHSSDLEKLQSIINYMNNNLQKELDVEVLAKYAMMSKRNFYRYFKQMTGVTPMQYLISLRLRKAVQLRRFHSLSLDEVAFQCGFCDANYLSRCLKKKLNLLPKNL